MLQTDFLDYLIESSDFSNLVAALLEFYDMGHASKSLPGLRYAMQGTSNSMLECGRSCFIPA
ncbi:hypothetical protein FNV43_RR00196 [Rhamnella rubrinervis]|uniref:Uncharacterized protein n=1 Tax=Rhamnella rubrinervis TaxID=2594499 RepID=A0A8K0HQ60_9ROSA|nr:hypothetical protein FNV43_RR00196 [Rhamnella rubrinervis]